MMPKSLIVGGHSLGGTQALMHGYNLQTALGKTTRVDVLAVGAPLVRLGSGGKDTRSPWRACHNGDPADRNPTVSTRS